MIMCQIKKKAGLLNNLSIDDNLWIEKYYVLCSRSVISSNYTCIFGNSQIWVLNNLIFKEWFLKL